MELYRNMVFIDMGRICATAKKVEPHLLECEINNPGFIYENSQVTFVEIGGKESSSLKEELLPKDITFCLENDIDYIIHSIYQGKQEILDLKKLIQDENEKLQREANIANEIKIIAKLENEEAIKEIEGILS